jgi:ubiquinol-cytochrome c reductase cytochrome c1 subunit
MVKLKRTARLLVLAVCLVSASGYAAGGAHVDSADIDPDNVASLQRGARNFMNYCSGCHSAQYVRYSTIGKHLGLSDEQLIDNLMFNAEKTFETIRTSMSAEDALRWYGVAPPDMSLIARSKGVDYIYTFLKGFYVSPDSPTGVNNVVLAGTSMPHVLAELQGYQTANFKVEEDEDGSVTTTFEGFEKLSEGSLDAEEYDDFVRDTVNFLAYISEPIRSDRIKLGVWVLMFLVFFYILASMLKKQIWKDVK